MSTKRTILKLSVVLLLIFSEYASANCIHWLVTPRECDFKNEDTNLFLYQPPLKWTSDEKVQTAIDTGREFADQYLNSVKLTGDNAIRQFHAGKEAAQQAVMAIQAAQAGIGLAANDPWNLKFIYTDLICGLIWQTVEAASGIRTGECDFDWLSKAETVQENIAVVQKIRDIINNPHLILGEEWGDIAEDMERVKAEYNELETMARNLTGDEMEAALRDKFKTFQEHLTNPINPHTYRTMIRADQDEALENTVRDILMATQANAKNLYGAEAINNNDPNYVPNPLNPEIYKSDIEESEGLKYKNELLVGRMQATELRNNSMSLQGQALMDIVEQQRATGYMFGLDMQSQNDDENHSTAWSTKLSDELQLPGEELEVNDGAPIGLSPAHGQGAFQ